MKKAENIFFTFFMLALSLGMILVSPNTIKAEECRIVRIHGGGGTQLNLNIEPKTMWITPGTCVVWVNWSRTPEVKVIFEEGKVCHDITDASAGFTMNPQNCYVTNFIPYGGTSSLMFKEKGTFDYKVVRSGATPIIGKIIVQEPKQD